MSIQFKKGVIELCVLSILKENDRYGYELVKSISEKIKISEGSIYPLLKKLLTQGLCETYFEESQEGPRRKYYKLTDAGEREEAKLHQEWDVFTMKVNQIIRREEDEDE